MEKKRIYLDYAATTPVAPQILKAMKPYFSEIYGNPFSAHWFGQKARQAIEKARKEIAEFLGCQPLEIIFTSGATESNNLAIKGIIKNIKHQPRIKYGANIPHIITSSIEHPCVLETCKSLEEDGLAEVDYLPVTKAGLIKVSDVEEAIKDNTVLVSIMYANNEIGTIQPIREIGKLIKNIRKTQKAVPQFPIFHTDAVQAINYLNCQVDYLGVDLLSISAHKIYGPKGVGALYIRAGTSISRIQDGGEQEYKLRSGTHNTAGIVGLGEAISKINPVLNTGQPRIKPVPGQVQEYGAKVKSILELKDKLINGVLKNIPGAKLNGSRIERLPNNANFSFPGAEGEAILMALDLEGIAVSTGSACASESLEPSHVLIALGLKPEDAHSSIRVTLGKYTTEAEINKFLEVLPRIVERLRKISGQGKGSLKVKLPDDFGC